MLIKAGTVHIYKEVEATVWYSDHRSQYLENGWPESILPTHGYRVIVLPGILAINPNYVVSYLGSHRELLTNLYDYKSIEEGIRQ
jgi:hypothetical protein